MAQRTWAEEAAEDPKPLGWALGCIFLLSVAFALVLNAILR